MDAEPSMASIGALIGSPARAAMLALLFDGRALTATELSQAAGVSAATASEHLGKLVSGGLLLCEKHGRHRYYKLAGDEVAEALEPLIHLVRHKPAPVRQVSSEQKLIRCARLCYDHMAGALGVSITTAMVDQGYLRLRDRHYDVTSRGEMFFFELGIDLEVLRKTRRQFAPQCLDWSERKPHVAGALGAAITDLAFSLKWIERTKHRRIIKLTDLGREQLEEKLGIKP
ncbi:helix-turn-helix transcriptional regulator [Kiloniella sp. EL199]|uniref:ArsR/SmtB family transcription factor n=1 Tax=Kiloniella sp. EL199 TaxID=2107581 RepID=UPI000EA3697D|nr:winged helix-turn-helix domain-containing protein [Kiloniella sp. EL199]